MLLTVIVYVAPVCPWVKLPVWVFVTVRSGAVADTVVESVAVSLLVLVSPPPLTLTLLTSGLPALAATLTVSVMGLPEPPAAITALDVQVTTCPAALQVQPVPVPDT